MGLYYEGFVSDAPAVLEEYYKETVTSFGVRDSSRRLLEHCKENECTDETTAQDGKKVQLYMYRCKEASSHNLNPLQLILQKPQPRIYWTYKQGNTTVEFGNTPFIVGDIQHLQCQYSPQYYKSKLKKGKQ